MRGNLRNTEDLRKILIGFLIKIQGGFVSTKKEVQAIGKGTLRDKVKATVNF